MITNFSDKTFIFKNCSKWVVVFLAYMILSRNPLLYINNMDLVPQINVRELVFFLTGQTLRFAWLGMSIAYLCVSLVNVFIEKCNILNNLYINDKTYKNYNNNDFGNFEIIDFSNPFLLSIKTKSLRE